MVCIALRLALHTTSKTITPSSRRSVDHRIATLDWLVLLQQSLLPYVPLEKVPIEAQSDLCPPPLSRHARSSTESKIESLKLVGQYYCSSPWVPFLNPPEHIFILEDVHLFIAPDSPSKIVRAVYPIHCYFHQFSAIELRPTCLHLQGPGLN